MVTVGSRQSQLYGRIYDKGKESKQPEWEGYIRHELEVKEEQARDLHFWLMEEITREHMIKAIVGNYFEKRGCPMYWEDFETRETPAVEKRTRTDETKLSWLATQVAPTVRDLIDHGKGAEALTALLYCVASDDTAEEVLRQAIKNLGR
jgi:DNA relaxase NicK